MQESRTNITLSLSRILSLSLALRCFALFLAIHAVAHRHTCNHTDLNPFKDLQF